MALCLNGITRKSLTSKQAVTNWGRLAFARMMECLAGNAEPQELLIKSTLVEGGSI
jgi:hypothetical protein